MLLFSANTIYQRQRFNLYSGFAWYQSYPNEVFRDFSHFLEGTVRIVSHNRFLLIQSNLLYGSILPSSVYIVSAAVSLNELVKIKKKSQLPVAHLKFCYISQESFRVSDTAAAENIPRATRLCRI
jgi:hypothetical protein